MCQRYLRTEGGEGTSREVEVFWRLSRCFVSTRHIVEPENDSGERMGVRISACQLPSWGSLGQALHRGVLTCEMAVFSPCRIHQDS